MSVNGLYNFRYFRSPHKSLPNDNYLKWTNKDIAVAGRLEITQSYRTAGRTGKNTWYGPPNGANTYTPYVSQNNQQPVLDADGDPKMGVINSVQALQAAINAFGKKTTNNKSSAPWRFPQEFKRLSKEGNCIRCASKSYNTRACPRFQAARKPDTIAHFQQVDIINSPVEALRELESESNEGEMSGKQ